MIILIRCICESVIVLATSRPAIFFINLGISKQRDDLSFFSAVCIIMQQELRVSLIAQSRCLLSNYPNIQISHINNALRKVY
jgi:hypothetical protein